MYDQDFESYSAPAASHLVGTKTSFNNRREFQLSDRNLLIFLAFLTTFFFKEKMPLMPEKKDPINKTGFKN